VSTWKDSTDENNTAPAWNIHQYGYMGGASQGNLGVVYGARRQITSQGPEVPSLAEKEKRLREKIEQEKRDAEERQRREQAERDAENERARQDEERAKLEEERRWAEETRRMREREEQDRIIEEDDRRRKQDAIDRAERAEQQRRLDQEAAATREREQRLTGDRTQQRATADFRLNGQFLSQYQADQSRAPTRPLEQQKTSEAQRIADLERQLAELRASQADPPAAKDTLHQPSLPPRNPSPSLPPRQQQQTSHEDDWTSSERDFLKSQHQKYTNDPTGDAYPTTTSPPTTTSQQQPPQPRPLPDPSTYSTSHTGTNRTDRFLSSNPAPTPPQPTVSRTQDYSSTHEIDSETTRRLHSQTKTRAGGWASKSLLEKEMERERERQREWEESQKETAGRERDVREGGGARSGGSWDVNQYGFTGGDNQGKNVGVGLGVGGARRQIIGPRPPP
jgi:transgelin